MTILPITGAADDADRIQASAVDGFVVWTTADDDPIVKAVRATRRPAVVHGGPAVHGLGLVSIDNRAAARAEAERIAASLLSSPEVPDAFAALSDEQAAASPGPPAQSASSFPMT